MQKVAQEFFGAHKDAGNMEIPLPGAEMGKVVTLPPPLPPPLPLPPGILILGMSLIAATASRDAARPAW